MKKIITSMLLIAFVGFFVISTASAEEPLCGCGKVLGIQLLNSNTSDVPRGACKVAVSILTDNGQTWTFTALAFGTQINLALLKAYNYQEDVEICTLIRQIGPSKVAFTITDVTFPCAYVFPELTTN